METVYPVIGTVTTKSGKLNVRKQPNTTSSVLDRIPKGEMIALNGYKDGWYSIDYNGHSGYVSSEFVTVSSEAIEPSYTVTFTVANKAMLEELSDYLNDKEVYFVVSEAGD